MNLQETVNDRQPLVLVRQSVFEQLRADILSCRLHPGSQIQERQLVERFQVSKSPIRDALLKLEEEGLVEVLPRKGYRVTAISLTDSRELYDIRQVFETECVGRISVNATPKVLSMLDDFRTARSDISVYTWIDYNHSFHTFIAANCGNRRLARMACNVIDQVQRLTYVSVSSRKGLKLTDFVAEHAGIIDAIQRRDRRQAVSLMRTHVESSRRRSMAALEAAAVIA